MSMPAPLPKCPRCGGSKIRRSASWLRHIGRVRGSHRRYCLDCGEKWNEGAIRFLKTPLWESWANLPFFLLLILLGIILVAMTVQDSKKPPQQKSYRERRR
jgi:hypothetical protein